MLAFVATAAVANSCPDGYSVYPFPNGQPPFSACATNTMTIATYAWPTFSTLAATELCTPATEEFECCLADFYSNFDDSNTIKCYSNFDAATYEFDYLLPQYNVTCSNELKSVVFQLTDEVAFDRGLAAVNCSAISTTTTSSTTTSTTVSSVSGQTTSSTTSTTDSSVSGAELSTDTIVGISVGAAAGLGLVYGIISACA